MDSLSLYAYLLRFTAGLAKQGGQVAINQVTFKMFSEICHNVIIVEQRIVAVKQGDNFTWSFPIV
jgi:hypothetical protein